MVDPEDVAYEDRVSSDTSDDSSGDHEREAGKEPCGDEEYDPAEDADSEVSSGLDWSPTQEQLDLGWVLVLEKLSDRDVAALLRNPMLLPRARELAQAEADTRACERAEQDAARWLDAHEELAALAQNEEAEDDE